MKLISATVASFTFAVVACSSDPTAVPGGVAPTPTTPSDPAKPNDRTAPTQKLFAVQTTAFGPSTVSYIAAVKSLNAGEVIDDAKSIEVPGYGIPAAVEPPDGNLYVLQDSAPVISKYRVNDDLTFTKGPELNLAAQGYTGSVGHKGPGHIISPTKGYVIDPKTYQLYVFNPTDMTFTKKVSLEALKASTTASGELETTPRRRGKDLVFSVHFVTTDEAHSIENLSVYAFIDTETDALTSFVDRSCAVGSSAVASNGDIYWNSSTVVSADFKLRGAPAGTPCMVRMKAADRVLDPTFKTSSTAITGADISGSVYAAPGDFFYTLAFEKSLFTGAEPATADDYFFAKAWKWWRAPLGSTTKGEEVTALGISVGTGFTIEVDGKSYLTSRGADSSSTLLDTASNPPAQALTVKATIVSVVRVK